MGEFSIRPLCKTTSLTFKVEVFTVSVKWMMICPTSRSKSKLNILGLVISKVYSETLIGLERLNGIIAFPKVSETKKLV